VFESGQPFRQTAEELHFFCFILALASSAIILLGPLKLPQVYLWSFIFFFSRYICSENGRPYLNRSRCAPNHFCGCEEAFTICVPEVAAGDSEATAILGICRTYAIPTAQLSRDKMLRIFI
jgi:hypothetical protein